MITDLDGTPLTFAVQAVPWDMPRANRAVSLQREIAAHGNPASIVWDRHHDGSETWRRVLEHLAEAPGSGVLIEDDVYFCRDWAPIMQQTVTEHPHEMVQFYGGQSRSMTGRHRAGDTFWANVCVRFPPGAAAELREWVGDRQDDQIRYYFDVATGHWMRETGRRYWQHAPSLVQHEQWMSAMDPDRSRNRQAHNFVESGRHDEP